MECHSSFLVGGFFAPDTGVEWIDPSPWGSPESPKFWRFLRPTPAPARPMPSSKNVAGSGTGEAVQTTSTVLDENDSIPEALPDKTSTPSPPVFTTTSPIEKALPNSKGSKTSVVSVSPASGPDITVSVNVSSQESVGKTGMQIPNPEAGNAALMLAEDPTACGWVSGVKVIWSARAGNEL
jgi:hypothetical protein